MALLDLQELELPESEMSHRGGRRRRRSCYSRNWRCDNNGGGGGRSTLSVFC